MSTVKISALTSYTTPLDADVLPIVDTANTTTKKVTWANIKATLKTYFDTQYEVPLTFGDGLTRTGNDIDVDVVQNITKLSNLTTNGFVKTSGGDGTLSIDTTVYGTGNVTKVGTPVDNQIGVWTGDGTIEGDASLTWDGTSFNIATSKNFQIAGVTILTDSAGTTTLSNIDVIDATTESTIEAAIDTLANLTSIQGRTVTLADAGANAIFGWDDTAGAYENLSQSEVKAIIGNASDSTTGVVELATAAETTTGTDATRAVTPDGFAGSDYGKRVVQVLVSDPNGSAITTGNSKAGFRISSALNSYNLVGVAAALSTVSSSGAPNVMIRRSRRSSATARTDADMLSTAITIDQSEFDTVDAATPAVINTSNDDVVTGDHIYIDIDGAGTGAKGLMVELTFQLP